MSSSKDGIHTWTSWCLPGETRTIIWYVLKQVALYLAAHR
jgi:hypothetical protein